MINPEFIKSFLKEVKQSILKMMGCREKFVGGVG